MHYLITSRIFSYHLVLLLGKVQGIIYLSVIINQFIKEFCKETISLIQLQKHINILKQDFVV